MTLCSFVLVASEFLPVGLLSPIAETLRLTEGQAGQAIAISGVFAVVTSLSISVLLGRIDRRRVVLALIAMLIVSGIMVAFAPSYLVFMTGRALIGVAIGGFWSMSAAIAIQLVPEDSVGKALAIISGGTALATALAAPLGSFLGSLIGWRGAFFCVVPVAVGALVWQAIVLPKLPVAECQSARAMLGLLHSRAVLLGLFAVAMLFVGQFALFTYLRPFLEQVTHVSVVMLSVMLLVVGASGFIGTVVIGRLVVTRLFLTLWMLPAAMAAVAVGLALFGGSAIATAALLAIWGFTGTAAPVGWWTWLARTLPEDAEAGGGLMVAVVQLAITLGATVGGVVYDTAGAVPEFLTSAALLGVAAIAALTVARHDRTTAARHERSSLELGVSASALSHALKGLEGRLGVRLLNRTNRSVTQTAAGEDLRDAITQPFSAIDQTVEDLNRYRDAPTGRIRLNVVVDAATLLLSRVLPEFADRYPDIDLDIVASDRMADIVGDGFDAGIRHGGIVPEDVVAQRISGDIRWVVAGSRAYLDRFGEPQHPDDLQRHRCLGIRLGDDRIYRWDFEGPNGEFAVSVPSKIYINEGRAMLGLALGGAGLMYGPEPLFAPYCARGELRTVLCEWATTGPGYYVYYSSRRQVPAGLRLLIDLIRERHPLGL